jgi:hypothetical protein
MTGRVATARALARPGKPESCIKKIQTPIVSAPELHINTETVSSLNADIKIRIHPAIIPGRKRGTVMSLKVRKRLAPEVAAASSRES